MEDGVGQEDAADAVEEPPEEAAKPLSPSEKYPLEPTVETLEDLVSLFDLNRGLELSHPPICAWLRSLLVPELL